LRPGPLSIHRLIYTMCIAYSVVYILYSWKDELARDLNGRQQLLWYRTIDLHWPWLRDGRISNRCGPKFDTQTDNISDWLNAIGVRRRRFVPTSIFVAANTSKLCKDVSYLGCIVWVNLRLFLHMHVMHAIWEFKVKVLDTFWIRNWSHIATHLVDVVVLFHAGAIVFNEAKGFIILNRIGVKFDRNNLQVKYSLPDWVRWPGWVGVGGLV